MAMHPVGRLPASTYWRRRGALALGVVLVLLLVRSCTGGASAPTRLVLSATPRPGATSAATSLARPSGTPAATSVARPTATPVGTGSAAPVAPPTQAPAVVGCPDAALSLVSSTDQPSYAVGAAPALTLVVRNSGSIRCRRDLGSGVVEVRVLSGSDRIWSSDDCSTGRGSDLRTLAPGESRSVQLTWSGRRSQPGCTGDRAQARAGTYTLVARVGSLTRPGATFTIR